MKVHQKGFTLIELIVVISIISLLSSVVLSSLNTVRAKARDSQRLSDMVQLRNALQLYYNDHGSYPRTTSGVGLSVVYADPGCTRSLTRPDRNIESWIPGLVEGGYISELPRDPNPKDQAHGTSPAAACYMYASDGNTFILSAWATLETGPNTSTFYSRAGFRESRFSQQHYICNSPGVGTTPRGDYYKYSYTITNANCIW
jgi:prepilin-type N-terminal cleavage/methylation domain-containing protein